MSDLQQHRISVQEILLMYAQQLAEGYSKAPQSTVYKEKFLFRVKEKISTASPTTYIMDQEKEAKRVAYSSQDLQQFVNGFDNLSISLLQPYIMFEKYSYEREKTFYLNMNEANAASFRSFLDGSLAGRGTIGFENRKNPGGFGIKSLDLEYLANEKSGFSFNHYKLDLEVFCASMEDLLANLGTDDEPYTILDVLIAFPKDVKKFLEDVQNGTGEGELSSAYKTVLELGYNIQESPKEFILKQRAAQTPWKKKPVTISHDYPASTKLEDKNYSEQAKLLIQQYGAKTAENEKEFAERMKGLRFRVFLMPYKWTFDVQEKGNIVLKIGYFGYDQLVGSKIGSNVMATVDEVKRFQAQYKKAAPTKPTVNTARSAKELEEAKKQAKKDKEMDDAKKSGYLKALRPAILQRPYQDLGLMERSFDVLVDYKMLSVKGESEKLKGLGAIVGGSFLQDKMSAGFEASFKSMYKGYRITPKKKWQTDFDFDKVLKDDKSLTIENKHYVGEGKSTEKGITVVTGPDGTQTITATGSLYISYIPYFYLGDLLAVLSTFASQNLVLSGEFPAGSHIRFVTDTITFPTPWMGESDITINIAELPISWDFFMEWWRKKVLEKNDLVYKLEEFLQEFLGHFVQSLFKKADIPNATTVSIGSHCLVRDIETDVLPGAKHITYYLYHNKDEPDPVVRFYIGNARGLVKNVQFEIVDDTYLSSANMQWAAEDSVPDNNLQFQRAIYNCSITMFGNAIFQTGMTIEVVPSIVGVPFTSTPTMRNIYDLGIGGMFRVTSTKVSLRQGNFETQLKTRWVSKPVPVVVDVSPETTEQVLDTVYSNYGSGGYTSTVPEKGFSMTNTADFPPAK